MEKRWTKDMQQELYGFLSGLNALLLVKSIIGSQIDNYTYAGIREVYVTLSNGRKVKVPSAAFVLQQEKTAGRPPKRRSKVFHHPALELLGFIDKKSPEYLSNVVRTSISSPSFQAAATELHFQGIKVSAEQIRKLSYRYADLFMNQRIENTLNGSEKQDGLILEITADGGRTRMRENVKLKNGRRKKGSYEGNWREPVLFSIRVLNKKEELIHQVPQLMDATMGNWKDAFALLEEYLSHYNLKEAKQISFIADGSTSIWSNVKPMMQRLEVQEYKEIVDFMHARQNMNEVIALINQNQSFKTHQQITRQQIYDLLWEGDIRGIRNYIQEFFGNKRRDKKAALKKLDCYFAVEERFAYSKLKKEGHPIGSGTVESAIRRVINMKLKSNGIFWLEDNCERMLYLRCQFLAGRWEILKDKLEERRLSLYGFKDLGQERKAG